MLNSEGLGAAGDPLAVEQGGKTRILLEKKGF